MKRSLALFILLAALAGCSTPQDNSSAGGTATTYGSNASSGAPRNGGQ